MTHTTLDAPTSADHRRITAVTARTGQLIDRFRDRVIFSVIDDGRVLGFVGRRRPDLTDIDLAGRERQMARLGPSELVKVVD